MSVATFSKLFPGSVSPAVALDSNHLANDDDNFIISDIEFGNMIGSLNRQLADSEGDDTPIDNHQPVKIIESEFTNRKSADEFIAVHEQLGYHCSEYESYNYPRQYIVVRMKYDS